MVWTFYTGPGRVVALDMRGFGESEKPSNTTAYTMSTLVEDIKQFIEYLRKIAHN